MAAHRYWRLYCRKTGGSTSFAGVTEIEMATSAAGADVTSTSFAIGDGNYQAGTATDAFNNDFTTDVLQWDITDLPAWVGQDFGAGNDKDIVEVRIRPDKDGAARTFGAFDVQYSDDGSTWTTLWTVNKSGYVVGTTVTFNPPSAVASRYWRVRGDTFVDPSGMSCAEMEMRLTLGGADQTGSGTQSASTSFGVGFGASKAFDNDVNSFWSSTVPIAQSEWIQYDFGSGVTKDIAQIAYTARNDGTYDQSPTSGWVESSNDNVNFLPRKTFSGLTWTNGGTNVINIGAMTTPARRRQMFAT